MKKLTLILLIALFTCSLAAQTRETWTYEMTEVPIPVGTGDNEINLQLMGSTYAGVSGFTVDENQNIYILTHFDGIKKFNINGEIISKSSAKIPKAEIIGTDNEFLYTYYAINQDYWLHKFDMEYNLLNSYQMDKFGGFLFIENNKGQFGLLYGSRLGKVLTDTDGLNINYSQFNPYYNHFTSYNLNRRALIVNNIDIEYDLLSTWEISRGETFRQEDNYNNLYFEYYPGETFPGYSKIGIINYKSNTIINTDIKIYPQGVEIDLMDMLLQIDKEGVIYYLYMPDGDNIKLQVWNKIN